MSDRIKKIFKKYYFLIGIIIFIFLISKLDFAYYKKILSQINLRYFLSAYLMLIPYYLIKSYRWKRIMEVQNLNYSLKDSFLMFNASTYLGVITPSRFGELSRAIYLKKDGHSLGKSFVSLFLDRLIELLFLSFWGIISMLIFMNMFKQQLLFTLLLVAIILIIILLSLKNKKITYLLRRAFYFLLPSKYQKSWQINYQDFKNDLKSYKIKNYLTFLGIGLVIWLVYFIIIALLAKGIAIDKIPIIYLLASLILSSLVNLLPLSISGIGTRDLLLILIFSYFGVGKEMAIAFSSLILLLFIFSAFLGLFCWLIKPIRLKSV